MQKMIEWMATTPHVAIKFTSAGHGGEGRFLIPHPLISGWDWALWWEKRGAGVCRAQGFQVANIEGWHKDVNKYVNIWTPFFLCFCSTLILRLNLALCSSVGASTGLRSPAGGAERDALLHPSQRSGANEGGKVPWRDPLEMVGVG